MILLSLQDGNDGELKVLSITCCADGDYDGVRVSTDQSSSVKFGIITILIYFIQLHLGR